MTDHSLKERDQAVNWHPYTQMKTAEEIVPIVRGEGVYLFDENNKRYIDAISSWWVTLHGHAHPYIATRVAEQLHTLEHVIFAGFTHKPAIELSERLLALLPVNQHKVFYSDNGSTAVEVALKMCVQYAFNHQEKKTKILALKDAYHGDTFGAMSVSGRSQWTQPFDEMLFEVIFIDRPSPENMDDIKETILAHAEEIACFIYEPLVQGAGGMLMYHANDLNELMRFCRSNHILLIQDEVFVGFGRTGQLFAANHLSEQPDVMCFSKGLTGGTMALGVTTCSQQIYDRFYSDDRYKTLFHGHSFTANPLACTAALASLELLMTPETQQHIHNICTMHEQFAKLISTHPLVHAVRQCGTIIALELGNGDATSYFNQKYRGLYVFFLKKGLILRPLGNIVYLVPPYCISKEELTKVYQIISEGLNELLPTIAENE